MKYYIKLAVVALSLGLGLASCQKEYDATPDIDKDPVQNPLKGTFTCKTNGDVFTANGKNISLTDNNGVKTLIITGIKYADNKQSQASQQIVLTIPVYEGAVRYGVNGSANVRYINTDSTGSMTNFSSISGENYFIKVDGEYKGTFNALVANDNNNNDKIVISEGKFSSE